MATWAKYWHLSSKEKI